MSPTLALIGGVLLGGSVAGAMAYRLLARQRHEVDRARAVLDAIAGRAETVPIDRAIERAVDDAADRVAEAESIRHWLLGALDEASDAVVVVDRIGREVVRNEAARHFSGARHSEVLADDAMRELLQQALDGLEVDRELQLYGPPRQVLHLRAAPLFREGEVSGAVGFTRDITDARRVESMRRDFVANVSHELKTPIGALALLAETMAVSSDPAVMQQLADRVVREADRLARIVDDLLDLTLIEAQEAPARSPIPVRVAPAPPDVEVACDHRQVRSALVNLLDNAIKYSGPGQCVEIGATVCDDRAVFLVRDHGIGIPSTDLERIFERFYRVDRARSRETGGTGLGLSIVRHVLQAHGGEVTVTSQEGEGSTFTLTMPLGNGGPRSQAEAS